MIIKPNSKEIIDPTQLQARKGEKNLRIKHDTIYKEPNIPQFNSLYHIEH